MNHFFEAIGILMCILIGFCFLLVIVEGITAAIRDHQINKLKIEVAMKNDEIKRLNDIIEGEDAQADTHEGDNADESIVS